jgi:tetratricopeptide (TPR) repeat protein
LNFAVSISGEIFFHSMGHKLAELLSHSANRLRLACLLIIAPLFIGPCVLSAQSTARKKAVSTATRQSGSERADPQFDAARALLTDGQLEKAIAEIRLQLAANPKSVEGYNLLGIALTSDRDYEGARDAFQQALQVEPGSARTRINLGNLYLAQQKMDLAQKEFREVLRTAPSNSDANYNLGLILLATNHPVEAIPHFQRVSPATPQSQFNLLRSYLRADRSAPAQQLAKTISGSAPDDVQLHFTLGVLLASEKQYREAQFELEKANSLAPDTFEILYNLGESYLRAGDLSKAELVLKRATNLKPGSAEALYLLGQVYNDQARPLDALEILAKARKLAPENTDIIFLLARVSMLQNYFEDAIPLLESGIKLAPQRPELRAALGESFFMSGKADRALAEFQELVKIDPTARSYSFLGLTYRHLGRFDEAQKYFAEGVKLDPRNASCLFNLGYIAGRQGDQAKAEDYFQRTLQANPDFSDALLELANLRINDKRFEEAVGLLRRYVKVSRDPATGYYKLALAERSLKQFDAAQRDLSVFQTLSKNVSTGPYPYQHLFDYLDNRATLTAQQRTQLDITELQNQIKTHPGQPQDYYLLAESDLKLGKLEDARVAIAQLDQLSGDDFRTQTGIGVLLASYHQYDDAIRHFQIAVKANPDSDDVKFDLANAYFRKGQYQPALDTALSVSPAGQKDDSFLALLGDIYSHLGDSTKATQIFADAIHRNPDNDQYYLSLSLTQLRAGNLSAAEATLKQGLGRVPSSGKILWGIGVVSALHGDADQASTNLQRAVDLLPEWPGGYSILGVLYYQTGQYSKAREVLQRFKGSRSSGLDTSRIEQALANAPPDSLQPLTASSRQQFLQIALSLADRTL